MYPARAWILFAAVLFTPLARAQLMRLTLMSTHVDADFYDYDIAHTNWDETNYITRFRQPVAGTMTLEAIVNFSKPFQDTATTDMRFFGDLERVGKFSFDFGHADWVALPNGKKELYVDSWADGGLPDYNMIFEVGFNADNTFDTSGLGSVGLEFRTNAMNGPGEFWGDSTLWMTLDRVTLTPVPEPSTYGILAGLSAIGCIVWRHRRAKTPSARLG